MTILGLDVGGANLKAAAADRRAVSVPFPLWKLPEKLPAALGELIAGFPDAAEFAVTMTGELCDCYETKREGVNAILDAAEHAATGRPVQVWTVSGRFISVEEARKNHLDAAASNWHALATYAGRFAPNGPALLVDTGSTTTDIIPLLDGAPCAKGRTDQERLLTGELLYRGVGRTPIHAVLTERICAELFATTQDVFVVLGQRPEDASNCDTADGRPLTRKKSLARLARMLGADVETLPESTILDFAHSVQGRLLEALDSAIRKHEATTIIASGAGEFLIRRASSKPVISLNEIIGPAVSACAPAYALAMLAAE